MDRQFLKKITCQSPEDLSYISALISEGKIKLGEIKKSLKLRDFSDKNRKESPLLFVKGAVLVDTTKLTLMQMKLRLINLVEREITKKYGNI